MMNLVARVISTHELVVLSFYPFVQKYMQPHQTKVTNILAYAAMAGTSYMYMSHVTRTNESCHTYEGVMLHACINESCDTYAASSDQSYQCSRLRRNGW